MSIEKDEYLSVKNWKYLHIGIFGYLNLCGPKSHLSDVWSWFELFHIRQFSAKKYFIHNMIFTKCIFNNFFRYLLCHSMLFASTTFNLDKWICAVFPSPSSPRKYFAANLYPAQHRWHLAEDGRGRGPGLEAAGWDVAGAGQVWPGAGPHQSASCSLWLPSYPSTRQHSTTSKWTGKEN